MHEVSWPSWDLLVAMTRLPARTEVELAALRRHDLRIRAELLAAVRQANDR